MSTERIATAHSAGAQIQDPLVLRTVAEYRQWQQQVRQPSSSSAQLPTIGFVPTMGALHEGHLSLVQASIAESDYTVVSIFVNPAQFAPHEDLDAYPRTFDSDLAKLKSLASHSTASSNRKVDVIFLPTVAEMYPNGFTQQVEDQVGAFVEIRGLANEMEGKSRPGFFRGVATVVTKLFHVIQPDHAYFGQKDIQQSIILRRLLSDLLFAYPPSPAHLRVLPTGRDPKDGLALSSRNAYLTPRARAVSPVLYRALREAESVFKTHASQGSTSSADAAQRVVHQTLEAARNIVLEQSQKCAAEAVSSEDERVILHLDYITLNDPASLVDLEKELEAGRSVDLSRGAILSGAALIRQGESGRVTRLIDNILLGFTL
ncbi:pantoate-beta-alanine ligase [Tilletia horrida]|nr:pantoate-beta-alanine ligase [Tilletia horrida]